jgi:hypothetical protein
MLLENLGYSASDLAISFNNTHWIHKLNYVAIFFREGDW